MTFDKRTLLWSLPLSFISGATLASLQTGNWLIGFLAFSFLFICVFFALVIAVRWADGGKTLAWVVALAFALRLLGGVTTYLALPVNGFDDADDQAGYVYTDAHRRDVQAWDLARSDRYIVDAFNKSYAYDQYGGLLAFSALIYRYLSPDVHRPLLLVLLSAFVAALGLPFGWKAVKQEWGEKTAIAFAWVYALYPESVLLGGSSMRESYLLLFSAWCLWGFVAWHGAQNKRSLIWLALGILGMLLVSPAVALITLVIFAGWLYFTNKPHFSAWQSGLIIALIFIVGLFLLSSSLGNGNLSGSPLAVVNKFLREAAKLNLHRLISGSGWVQKIFDEMPEWLQIPFVLIYGLFQPVLPAALFEPTTLTWRMIAILRAVGWYSVLPVLLLSFGAGASQKSDVKRKVLIWLSLIVWFWILLTSLRGGADQWDNPRYRTILFLWQALLVGQVWVWWRETRNAWVARILGMEAVFLLFFGQWYVTRYFQFGGQLPFGKMVTFILGLWAAILAFGFWRDRSRHSV